LDSCRTESTKKKSTAPSSNSPAASLVTSSASASRTKQGGGCGNTLQKTSNAAPAAAGQAAEALGTGTQEDTVLSYLFSSLFDTRVGGRTEDTGHTEDTGQAVPEDIGPANPQLSAPDVTYPATGVVVALL
jgi:hypothetical protein